MTVIAWDGHTLAADRQAAIGDGCQAVCKIFRIEDCLVGTTGNYSFGMEMMEWLRAGAIAADFRSDWRDPDKGASLLVIRPDKSIWKFEDSPIPYQLVGPFAAAGSGSECAMVAMACGRTAVTAVQVVNKYLSSCGMGYDYLPLAPEPTTEKQQVDS
jgi:hypothetical protein